MEPKAFSRAKDHLQSAQWQLEGMKKASNLRDLSQAWRGFLTDAQRLFLMLRKATEVGASKAWSDTLQRTRNQDDLLKYVHHARNADDHGMERVAEEQSGRLGIAPGDGPAHIRTVTAIPGRGVSVEYSGARPAVSWTPDAVVLLPVKDRGVIYSVPTQHLGQRLPDAKAITAAETAYEYFAKAVEEAEKKFGTG